MRRRVLLLFSLILLCLPTYSHAQTNPIDASRRIDWTQAGISGGIPNRTTICATLNPGATAAQINSAIQACPDGQVVFLNAGTYNLSSGIDFADKSNVTLRGAGPNQTFLVFSTGVSCGGTNLGNVCFRSSNLSGGTPPPNLANWTAGYTKGATSITLSSVTNLQVGKLLILDQLDDSSDPGNIFVCATQGTCSTEGGNYTRSGRGQTQMVRVTAITGNTVTIDPGLHMPNWRASQSPQAWWTNDTPITLSGVENLAVNHTASGAQSGFRFFHAYNCWIKNVKSVNANRNHVWLYQAMRNVVRDSYFYGTKSAASQSYGVESGIGPASLNLVENNIFEHITAPMMHGSSVTGNVFGYNYSTDDFYTVASWMQSSSYLHNVGLDHILWEGNDGAGFTCDNIHGSAHFSTAFRNVWIGWEPGKTAQTIAVHLYNLCRYFNIVGNVLGRDVYHNNYQSVPPFGTNGNTSIYTLGWSGNGGTTGSLPNDPLVAITLMRWGNYDTINDVVRFVASEVPSGLSQFANSVPANNVLPASLYLSARPSWFGTVPWPPIGPEVTGGQDPTGHAYKIPARVCYENTPKNPDTTLIFDANNCYGGTVPPASPTGLTVQ